MKVIKLKSVHYINYNGIILTSKNPSVEATEENVKRLELYIEKGYVEVAEKKPEVIEKIKVEDIVPIFEEEVNPYITTEIKREPEEDVLTEAEVKAMNKKELMELCEKKGIAVKKSISVAKLEELVLNNQ